MKKFTALVVFGAYVLFALSAGRAHAEPTIVTFNVDSQDDVTDASPGNGVCETGTGNGVCTLRGAVQEANARFAQVGGSYVITLQAGTTYLLSIPAAGKNKAKNGDLNLKGNITIVDGGALTVINGNSPALNSRVVRAEGGTVKLKNLQIAHGNSGFRDGGLRLTKAMSTVVRTISA